MNWIQLRSPFVHRTLGSGATRGTFKISLANIPLQTSSPPPVSLPTAIRIPWKNVSAPFKHAEFDDSLRLSIALLVVELQGTVFPIFRFSKFRYHHLHHPLTGHNYSQKFLERCSLDLFDGLNPVVPSVWPCDHWFWRYKGKCSKFCPQKFRPTTFTLTKDHHHLQSGLHRRWLLDLCDAPNWPVVSICP